MNLFRSLARARREYPAILKIKVSQILVSLQNQVMKYLKQTEGWQ